MSAPLSPALSPALAPALAPASPAGSLSSSGSSASPGSPGSSGGGDPLSAAGGRPPVALPARGELPPYTANLLGPRRAALARELRRRLLAAGISWPHWIDARPGRLQVILGDCSDPPLGASAAALVARHGELVLDGLAALGLISGAARLVLCASEPATVTALRALGSGRAVEVAETPPVYPSAPEADVAGASDHAYTVPAAQLAAIGALVRGTAAPQLCTLAGAVVHPQVLAMDADVDAADADAVGGARNAATPAALVRRCGGAQTPAWVAVLGGALGGVLWPAETPLPAASSLCLILPVAHPLVARLRRGAAWQLRARNACLSCQACTDFCPVAQSGIPLAPHRLVRAHAGATFAPPSDRAVVTRSSAADAGAPGTLPSDRAVAASSSAADAADAAAAGACTGCGTCSVMCPADLLPGALIKELGLGSSAGVAAPAGAHALALFPPSSPVPPPRPVSERRLPLQLVLTRLGLDAYRRPPA